MLQHYHQGSRTSQVAPASSNQEFVLDLVVSIYVTDMWTHFSGFSQAKSQFSFPDHKVEQQTAHLPVCCCNAVIIQLSSLQFIGIWFDCLTWPCWCVCMRLYHGMLAETTDVLECLSLPCVPPSPPTPSLSLSQMRPYTMFRIYACLWMLWASNFCAWNTLLMCFPRHVIWRIGTGKEIWNLRNIYCPAKPQSGLMQVKQLKMKTEISANKSYADIYL